MTDTVASGNSGALDMMVVVPFYISIYQNLDYVRDLLHEVVITSRFIYLEKPVNITFEEVSLSNTFVIKAQVKAYVLDVKYEKALLTDVTSRGNKILNMHGVERPVIQKQREESHG